MHGRTMDMMKKFSTQVGKGMKILDVGSQDLNGSFKDIFPGYDYTGIDILEGKNVDMVVPPYDYPFPDNHFDIIISGSTLEHVKHPWRWIREVSRVLKPGGKVCIIAPHTHPYHAAPIDCWRIYPDGMRALFEEGGLTEIVITMDESWDGGTHPILGRIVLMNENLCADTMGIATK